MDKNILIIAGEPSGDIRAGELLKELRKLVPEAVFWGIGGDHMQKQGVQLVAHIRQFSMVGVWEVVKNLVKIRKQYKELTKNIRKRKPLLAVLVDYPGFNLQIARFLYHEKIPVIYYIIPQVWAWGRRRIKYLKKYINKSLVLFRFEENFLNQYKINCKFVGHPLVDTAASFEESSPEIPVSNHFTIALLPGSRKSEILNLFPVMLSTAEKIHLNRKDIRFIIAENSNINKTLYTSMLSLHPALPVLRVCDNTFAVLKQSDFAIVTSGTATLETALMEKPMIITYRAALLTYMLFRLFAKVPFLGLVNLIAGKEIVPELLQEDATAEKLSAKTLEIINDSHQMGNIKEELRKVKLALGKKGASLKAAEAISRFIIERNLM